MEEQTEKTALELAHEVRKATSAAIGIAKTTAAKIERGAGGREISLAITKLEEAKMWAGKACGELGGTLPEGYPHDNA